nr:hypothetical protein [Tanacetum cinerariifolium]
EGNNDENMGLNVGSEKEQDAEDDEDELYRDVNINLEGRVSSSMSYQFVTSMLNPTLDTGIDFLFETTSQMDAQAPTTVSSLTLSAPTLTPSTIPTISTLPQAPTPPTTAPSNLLIVQRYMDQRINEAIKVVVQIQSDKLRDEAQAKNEEFLKNLDENIQKIIKEKFKEHVKVHVFKILPKIEKTVNEQLEAEVLTRSSNLSKTSYVVAADLSEMELKKILIEKIEGNKSIHRSDEQRNLYKALVEAYEYDKIILDTYGDVVMLKRRRDDDADKDEEPSAGSDRGSKRRREGNEPKSTSAPKEKATRTTGKSTQRSKSQKRTASESAPAEEPLQTTHDLEEPSHQEFVTATHGSIQSWISKLAKQADSRSFFNELMDTHVDFSAFLMNRLKVDTLTLELLAGPTYELMKRSCKSLVELEFFLKEVYKATTDQLDWNNPEGHQYPYNLLKHLPLIPSSEVVELSCLITSSTTTSSTYVEIEDMVPYTMWSQEPVSYDKHALWGISHWGCKRQQFYGLTVNRESARDVYSKRRIIAVTELQIVEWHNYKHFDWITIRVESYQKKLNLTRPDMCRFDLKCKEAYTAYSNPRGFIYQNKDKQNMLMRIDELHKFSDGMPSDVRTTLDDHLKAKDEKDHQKFGEDCWRETVRGRLQDASTDHMIYHMISLSFKEPEGSTQGYLLVSVEVLRYDKRSNSENMGIVPTEMELILEHTQQGISHEVSVSDEGVEE